MKIKFEQNLVFRSLKWKIINDSFSRYMSGKFVKIYPVEHFYRPINYDEQKLLHYIQLAVYDFSLFSNRETAHTRVYEDLSFYKRFPGTLKVAHAPLHRKINSLYKLYLISLNSRKLPEPEKIVRAVLEGKKSQPNRGILKSAAASLSDTLRELAHELLFVLQHVQHSTVQKPMPDVSNFSNIRASDESLILVSFESLVETLKEIEERLNIRFETGASVIEAYEKRDELLDWRSNKTCVRDLFEILWLKKFVEIGLPEERLYQFCKSFKNRTIPRVKRGRIDDDETLAEIEGNNDT